GGGGGRRGVRAARRGVRARRRGAARATRPLRSIPCPAVNDVLRRRSVGAPAARSTLLTVLGEYLLPRPEGVWQEALIGSLRLLGVTPSAARQAVVRPAPGDWAGGGGVGRAAPRRPPGAAAEPPR